MNRDAEMAYYAISHHVGHETAHLSTEEQIAVYQNLVRVWDAAALRLEHELRDTSRDSQ